MIPPFTEPISALQEEGSRCKASLEAFTESVITRLGLSERESDKLRKFDASTKGGNMYLHFPFCFREAFPDVALEDLRRIALSGILWMSYMRAQDDTVDNGAAVEPALLFLRDLYLRESLRLLYGMFSPDSGFWARYSNYFDQYARAVLCESRDHSRMDDHYDDEEFCAVAKGKAAMAKFPVAALAVLSGRQEKMALLTESLDSFYVGYQYWDDLVDWKQDLVNSKYSLLLARAIQRIAPHDRNGTPDQMREKIGRAVYYSGLANEHLDRSYQWFERAAELSLEAACTVWAGYVKGLPNQTVVLADDLRSIIEKRSSQRATAAAAGVEGERP